MIKTAPEKVQAYIDLYFNLPLNGKKVPCPYFINIKKMKQRMGLRVLIGKGTPEEIISETLIYEKLRGVDLSSMSVDEIRRFMVKRHIGIDCSGFIVHILDYWLRSTNKKHLWQYLKYPQQSFYRRFSRMLRPVENISAHLLTGDFNTTEIKNLQDIRVGDLIRCRVPKRHKNLAPGHHVMIINEIEYENEKVVAFSYVHSTRQFDEQHGVRKGRVVVVDPKAPLHAQQWLEEYKGKHWTYDEICADPDYAGIRRLSTVPLS